MVNGQLFLGLGFVYYVFLQYGCAIGYKTYPKVNGEVEFGLG